MKKIFILFCFFTASFSAPGLIHHLTSLQKPIHQDIASTRLLNEIILRFYHVQRLAKGVSRLIWMSHKKLVPLHLYCEVTDNKNHKTLVINNEQKVKFTHPRIIWCVEHIEKFHSLSAFVEVWDDLAHYQLISDHVALREFTYLLFYLYKDVVHQEAFWKNRTDVESLDAILKKIPSLENADLEEILDVLDLLIDELPTFIEKYELTSGLTWKEWVKKYWLIAPLSAAVIFLKAYMHLFPHKKSNPVQALQEGI